MFPELAPWLDVAPAVIIAAAGVFARVAAVAFLLPGLGERSIPMRIRLVGALMLTWILSPLVIPIAGDVPLEPGGVVLMLLGEVFAGLLIGFAFRMLVYILQIVGMIAAQSLSISQIFGVGVGPDPEPTIATLLSMGGIVLALSAGLHVALVEQLAALYEPLPFGLMPSGEDSAPWWLERIASGFAIALSLAAPFVVIGFAYNMALGALNRAMPQLMVSFVGVPAIVWLGIFVLWMVTPSIFDAWGVRVGSVFFNPLQALR